MIAQRTGFVETFFRIKPRRSFRAEQKTTTKWGEGVDTHTALGTRRDRPLHARPMWSQCGMAHTMKGMIRTYGGMP